MRKGQWLTSGLQRLSTKNGSQTLSDTSQGRARYCRTRYLRRLRFDISGTPGTRNNPTHSTGGEIIIRMWNQTKHAISHEHHVFYASQGNRLQDEQRACDESGHRFEKMFSPRHRVHTALSACAHCGWCPRDALDHRAEKRWYCKAFQSSG